MKALTYMEQGKIDTTPLITHRYRLADIEGLTASSRISTMG